MDQKFEGSGCWFCKYCQQAHRDKLELFCHQVNEHPEYRDELNGNPYTTSSGKVYTVGGVSDARSTEMKRQSHNGYNNSLGQQHGGWYQAYPNPSTTAQGPTAGNGNTPIEYYVVVPNQSQSHGYNFGSQAVSQPQMMNVQVINQRPAYPLPSSVSSDYYPAQVANHPGKQDAEIGWNRCELKMSADSSNERTEPVDYFCWKCKGRFDNAAAYIDHSKFCISSDSNASQSTGNDSALQDQPTKKMKLQTSCANITSTTQNEHRIASLKRERKTASSVKPRGPKRNRSSKGSRSSEGCSSTVPESSTDNEELFLSNTQTIGGHVPDGFPCTHCETVFPSNDNLASHLVVCKYRSKYYDSYQYKCIKCRESFEVYLDYKRHIAKHTGEYLGNLQVKLETTRPK